MSDAGPAIPEGRHRSGVLHGRRAGRPLRKDQRARMARDLPSLAIDLARLADPPCALRTAGLPAAARSGFRRRRASGPRGRALSRERVHRLRALPQRRRQACGTRRGARSRQCPASCRGCRRVARRAAPACLDGADVFYPDPWPKRRQRKRRFLSDDNLDRLARALKPGAPLRFATDIDDYAGWVLARILRSADFTWEARDGRRLAPALGGLALDPLRAEGDPRGAPAGVFHVPAAISEPGIQDRSHEAGLARQPCVAARLLFVLLVIGLIETGLLS